MNFVKPNSPNKYHIMKNVIFLGIISSFILFSCSKDTEETLVADFDAAVTGEAPNAQITITNNSVGATSWSWTFGEGANISESAEEAPASITVDKAGEISITLIATNGGEEMKITKTFTIAGNNAVVTYTDVAFALNSGHNDYGRLFSFETGEIYLDNEVDASNGELIHLAFGSMGNTLYYFESPTHEDFNIPNSTNTKVINYESEPTFSVEDFDAIVDDSALSSLTIEHSDDGFGNSSIPGTVLFEISTGQKGVIKTKIINSERILVDIKIQKY